MNADLGKGIEAYAINTGDPAGDLLVVDVTLPGYNISVGCTQGDASFMHISGSANTVLKHKKTYTIPMVSKTNLELDLSTYSPEPYGTSEIWIDYSSGSIITGSDWVWTSGSAPTSWKSNMRYCLILRNDGVKTLAHIDYSYPHTTGPIIHRTHIKKLKI